MILSLSSPHGLLKHYVFTPGAQLQLSSNKESITADEEQGNNINLDISKCRIRNLAETLFVSDITQT